MAIGLINSPTTPIPIGTVASPTWATQVEDNLNGLMNGTGPTLKSLQIDGTGGAASSGVAGHILISGGGTPGIVANAGAGTSPSVSISGNDTCGNIGVITGTSPTAGANVVTITFANAYAVTPTVLICLYSVGAGGVAPSGASWIVPFATTTGFVLQPCAATGALTASVQYHWTYMVIGST